MKIRNVITAYYVKENWSKDYEKRTYTMYCIIKDKLTKSEIFRTSECQNRADSVREVQQYLTKHPEMINEFIC